MSNKFSTVSFLKAGLTNNVIDISKFIIGIVGNIILFRILVPEDYGFYALWFSLYSVLRVVVSFGMSLSLYNKSDGDVSPENIKGIYAFQNIVAVEVLLKHGAFPSERAVDAAVCENEPEILKLLLEYRAQSPKGIPEKSTGDLALASKAGDASSMPTSEDKGIPTREGRSDDVSGALTSHARFFNVSSGVAVVKTDTAPTSTLAVP